MEALVAGAIGVLVTCGVYLLLRGRTFSVVLGLSLMSYAVNLFLFSVGGITVGKPPVLDPNALNDGLGTYADPLPQALVLTAIVIGFGMTAFLVVLALKSFLSLGNDHVDGGDTANTSFSDSTLGPGQ